MSRQAARAILLAHQLRIMSVVMVETLKCEYCGCEFATNKSRRRFCSRRCKRRNYFARPDKKATKRLRAAERRLADPETRRAIKREQYQRNPTADRERQKRHRQEKPEWWNAARARRRARKIGAAGSHTVAEWEAIKKRQNGCCAICGARSRLTRDHIIPLSRGGSDFAYNIQGLCKSCNSSKGAKILAGIHPSLFDRIAA